MPLSYFSCLIDLARTSNTMLNRSSESRYPCLVPDLSVKALTFCLLCMILAAGFSHMAFIMLRFAPSTPTLLNVFIINGCYALSNAFFCIYWHDYVIFVFPLVYVMYYTYWFENVVSSLYSWDESHLIMVYDLFNVLLDAVCQSFVEDCCVYFHLQ